MRDMSPTVKTILYCVGVFIVGGYSYYQLHAGPGVLVTTPTFWVGFCMAGLYPLGVYFMGLAQRAPWETPPAAPPPAPGPH